MFVNRRLQLIWMLIAVPGLSGLASAALPARQSCDADAPPMVIQGAALPDFLGVPSSTLRVLAMRDSQVHVLSAQVDARDAQGRYLIPRDAGEAAAQAAAPLDANDELVFMAADACGERVQDRSRLPDGAALEFAIDDPRDGQRHWFYIGRAPESSATDGPAPQDYVQYSAARDTLETRGFRLGFSPVTPFIINSLQWRQGEAGWSANVIDSMKLRHTGRLFGLFPFARDHSDYVSEVVAVKDGPVRVLRRTINRVHVLLNLKSPQVIMDYIVHRNGFQMDIVVDMPFRIGLFFDDVQTTSSLDWNDARALPPLFLRHASLDRALALDGRMSPQERALNTQTDTELHISSSLGRISMDMSYDQQLPITRTVFLVDDATSEDPPETIPGQFGNIGFRTVGWEKLQARVSHLYFTSELVAGQTD